MKFRLRHRVSREVQPWEVLQGKETWVVRHGEVDSDRGGRLTPTGLHQAFMAAQRLKKTGYRDPALFVVSSAFRTKETAEAIDKQLHPLRPVHEGLFVYRSNAIEQLGKSSSGGECASTTEALLNTLGTVVMEACAPGSVPYEPCHLESVVFVGHEPLVSAVKQAYRISGWTQPGEVVPFDAEEMIYNTNTA